MGLEMIADDDDVSSGGISGLHRFGSTYSATDDEGDGGVFPYLAYDIRRDGSLGTLSGFEIDRFLAHQFRCYTGVDDGREI